MKKSILTLATIMSITFISHKVSFADEVSTSTSISIENKKDGYINTDKVNFRSGPSIDNNVYYTLEKMDKVNILNKEGNWTKIKHGEKVGYIYSKYISNKSKLDRDKLVMNVKATAYAGDTITSTGTTPKWGTIAVDPSVIPYGTKVYIPEFDKVFVAEDTGSDIKKNRIDIFMDTEDHCNKWGVRNIDIYILD